MAHKFDLSKMSYTDLQELKLEIDSVIGKTLSKERDEAAKQIRKIADSVKMSVRELTKLGGERRATAAPVPKFRDPTNPNKVWTGRGAAPKWVKDWEKAGKSREDLRIV